MWKLKLMETNGNLTNRKDQPFMFYPEEYPMQKNAYIFGNVVCY